MRFSNSSVSSSGGDCCSTMTSILSSASRIGFPASSDVSKICGPGETGLGDESKEINGESSNVNGARFGEGLKNRNGLAGRDRFESGDRKRCLLSETGECNSIRSGEAIGELLNKVSSFTCEVELG